MAGVVAGNRATSSTVSESRILSWSRDNTDGVLLLHADLDFPAEQFEVWIQAGTATEYDFVPRQVKTLDPELCRAIRRKAFACRGPELRLWEVGSSIWLASD
jgi:hypothetical protein